MPEPSQALIAINWSDVVGIAAGCGASTVNKDLSPVALGRHLAMLAGVCLERLMVWQGRPPSNEMRSFRDVTQWARNVRQAGFAAGFKEVDVVLRRQIERKLEDGDVRLESKGLLLDIALHVTRWVVAGREAAVFTRDLQFVCASEFLHDRGLDSRLTIVGVEGVAGREGRYRPNQFPAAFPGGRRINLSKIEFLELFDAT